MAKIVCTIQRLDHLDAAAFRQYYEGNHAPLALQYMPFTRYARSYPVDGGGEGLGFDVVPEFWLEDPSAVGTILSGPAGKVLAEDEARFFHRDRVAAAPVDEFVLAKPRVDMGALRRRRLMLLRADASRREAIRGAAFDWACSFSKPGREVVVDFITAVNEPAFPADILVWTDVEGELPALSGPLSLWRSVEVETAETAADKLIPVPA